MRRPAQFPDDEFDHGVFEGYANRGRSRRGSRRWMTVRDYHYLGANKYELVVYSECWDLCDQEFYGTFHSDSSKDVEDAVMTDDDVVDVNVTNSTIFSCYEACAQEDANNANSTHEWPSHMNTNFTGRARISGFKGRWLNLEVAFEMTKVWTPTPTRSWLDDQNTPHLHLPPRPVSLHARRR